MKDKVVDGVVQYLRSRARAESAASDLHPDASMLAKAADLIDRMATQLAEAKERNVHLQRSLGEYEAREIGGEA